MFLQVPCIICFLEKYFFLTYFQVNTENFGNFAEICNKYQSKVDNCTKTKFCFKQNKSELFFTSFFVYFLSIPNTFDLSKFLGQKNDYLEILAKKHIFHKCVPVTSGICRISTKIENQKNKLVPSLYGLGESYKHIFFFILGFFIEIQKIYREIQSCTSLTRMSLM